MVAIFPFIEAKPRLCQAPSLDIEVLKRVESLTLFMVFIFLAASFIVDCATLLMALCIVRAIFAYSSLSLVVVNSSGLGTSLYLHILFQVCERHIHNVCLCHSSSSYQFSLTSKKNNKIHIPYTINSAATKVLVY